MLDWYLGVCGLSSLIVGSYIFYYWKRVEAMQRTPTLFLWALGFTIYGLVYAVGLLAILDIIPKELANQGWVNFLAYGLTTLGIILVYRGTIRFFTRSFFWRNLLPLLLILIFLILTFSGLDMIHQYFPILLLYSLLIIIPLYLALGILFASFYKYFNLFIRQFNGQTAGFLIVSAGWFVLLIGSLILPWLAKIYPLIEWQEELSLAAKWWFVSRIFAHLLFLTGFIFIAREMHKLLGISKEIQAKKS